MRCLHGTLPLSLLLAAAAATLAAPPAETATGASSTGTPWTAEEIMAAEHLLDERTHGCEGPGECAELYAEIALLERPGGVVGHVANERLEGYLAHARMPMMRAFEQGDVETRTRVLQLFREEWSVLFGGTEPTLLALVRDALEDDSPEVRQAAAELIAARPVHLVAHPAIDAAVLYPELTLAAVLGVANARDRTGARWLVEQLTHEDPLVRAAARRGVFLFGRLIALPLKRQIAEGDPAEQDAAIDALLAIATPEDEAALHGWLERRAAENPELAERVLAATAALEAGLYRPTPPPPVDFPSETQPQP
jgi:HEAT repeat protein